MRRRRRRNDLKIEGVLLAFAVVEGEVRGDLVFARRRDGGKFDLQREARLIAGGDDEMFGCANRRREVGGPGGVARNGLAGIINDNELLFDGFAGVEGVVLDGEVFQFAGDPGQQRHVVAEQGHGGGRGNPVGALVSQIEAGVGVVDKIGTETGLLEVIPIHGQILAAVLEAVAQFPKTVVLPGRIGGEAPGAESAPVVGGIGGLHRLKLIQARIADGIRVIPAEPGAALAELLRLPAEIAFFAVADLIGGIAEELGVPFRDAILPRHGGVAEFAPAVVPAAIQGPVPAERRAVFDEHERFDACGRPMLEPIVQFLDRHEVGVEVKGVDGGEIAR